MSEGAGKRRPTAEDLQEIIAEVADGASLRKACRELGVHHGHAHDAIAADDTLRDQYARAREQRGESMAEKVMGIAGKVMKGEVGHQEARVAIDAYKWAAGRMAPKAWGDKVTTEHTGPDGGAIVTRIERHIVRPPHSDR